MDITTMASLNTINHHLLDKVKSIFNGDDFCIYEDVGLVNISKVLSHCEDFISFPMGEQYISHPITCVNETRNARFKGDKIKLYYAAEYGRPDPEKYEIDFPQDPESEEFEGTLMFVEDWLTGEFKGDANAGIKEYVEEYCK